MTASTRSSERGLVRARGLSRTFGAKRALAPFDLEVRPGEVTGLLGPNGSGKSTFLRCLVGLVRPDSGSAVVDGELLRGDGTAVRKRVTYAPGEIAMYGELRGDAHLRWLLRARDRGAFARSAAIAERLGLPLAKRVRGYSHGMKRQLLFSAAMGPDVLVRILDEPTEGLDPSARGIVLDVLAEDARAGRTILLSSHHLGEVEHVCERIVFLARGELLSVESPASLSERAHDVLRLEFAPNAPLEGLAEELTAQGATDIRTDHHRVRLRLEEREPRAFLATLLASRTLPMPVSFSYGRPSLVELYEELYGVRGL